MSIKQKFNIIFKDPNVQFTIILGSGFHRQFIGQDSILSSWEQLLSKLSPDLKLTGDFHLDFEKIIHSKKTRCEDSSKTEDRILKCVKELLQNEQKRVLKDCKNCYPLWFALTSRKRVNNQSSTFFQMCDCECKNDA